MEEVGSSCSVDELDREVLVACLLSKLTVIVNVLRTNEFCCKYSCRMSYLFICTVNERVVHRELFGIGVTNEAAVCKTEGTFSQAEVVSYNAEMKICILILCKEVSEKIKSSVEAVVESYLVNAPVAPVLDVLDSSGVSVKTESYESVLEFSLDILDEDRRIERIGLDAHIIESMEEITDLLSHNRIELVLIHRKRVDEVIEGYVALLTFLDVSTELIKSKVRDN